MVSVSDTPLPVREGTWCCWLLRGECRNHRGCVCAFTVQLGQVCKVAHAAGSPPQQRRLGQKGDPPSTSCLLHSLLCGHWSPWAACSAQEERCCSTPTFTHSSMEGDIISDLVMFILTFGFLRRCCLLLSSTLESTRLSLSTLAFVRDARGEHRGHVVHAVQIKGILYLKTDSYWGCFKTVGSPVFLLQLALLWEQQEEDASTLQSLSSSQGVTAAGVVQSRVQGIVSEPHNSTLSPHFVERK